MHHDTPREGLIQLKFPLNAEHNHDCKPCDIHPEVRSYALERLRNGLAHSELRNVIAERVGEILDIPRDPKDPMRLSTVMKHVQKHGPAWAQATVFITERHLENLRAEARRSEWYCQDDATAVREFTHRHKGQFALLPYDRQPDEPFLLVMCTDHMVQNARDSLQTPECVAFMDGTFGTNNAGLTLAAVNTVLPCGVTAPVAFILTEVEDGEQYTKALLALKDHINAKGVAWEPTSMITDADFKLGAAISTVFPNATPFFCSFHVLRAWMRNLNAKAKGAPSDDRALCFKELVDIMYHRCTRGATLEEKDAEIGTMLTEWGEKWGYTNQTAGMWKFVAYINTTWAHRRALWAMDLKPGTQGHTTNNSVESCWRHMKDALNGEQEVACKAGAGQHIIYYCCQCSDL